MRARPIALAALCLLPARAFAEPPPPVPPAVPPATPSAAASVQATAPAPSGQPAGPETLCLPAVAAAEQAEQLPEHLLRSIAYVESGRTDPTTGTVAPWPWTVNAGGTGAFYATKDDAVAAVRQLLATGTRSIDVGCAQVNLLHHPDAFVSLDAAFDPATNALYAARFLNVLRRSTGSWPLAMAGYHSQTVGIGFAYARRVLAIWPGAGRFGDLPPVPPVPAVPGAPQGEPPKYNAYTPGSAAWLRRLDEDRARLLARLGTAASRPGTRTRMLALARRQPPRQPFWATRMLAKARLTRRPGPFRPTWVERESDEVAYYPPYYD